MNKPKLPIEFIGEDNWINKLVKFLEQYDVEVEGLKSIDCMFKIPEQMEKYFKYFGGISSSDFMYNLYSPKDFIKLSVSDWSFINENFSLEETEKYIVFSESPGNDPVCLNMENDTIHIFSHDPLKKAKIFEDFNQYLQYEVIEIQKLMGDIEWNKDDEIEYHKEKLAGKDIDYTFRYMKFC